MHSSSLIHRSPTRAAGLIFAGFCALFAGTGCSDDEAPRNVVTVVSVNANGALNSDIYNNGQDDVPGTLDDFVVEDEVEVRLTSDPHDDALFLFPGTPFGSVVFERYEVVFESEEEIPTVRGALGWRVDANSFFTGSLTVVPYGMKIQPPLSSLVNGGEVQATAKITFFGVEQTSKDAVTATAILPVFFANWSDL